MIIVRVGLHTIYNCSRNWYNDDVQKDKMLKVRDSPLHLMREPPLPFQQLLDPRLLNPQQLRARPDPRRDLHQTLVRAPATKSFGK